MQITVRLTQQSTRSVTYDHNYALSSALNEAMRAFHPELSRDLHNSGSRAKIAISEIYHLDHRRGEAFFRIASPDERLLRLYGGALVSTGKMQIGQSEYTVTGTDAHPSLDPIAPFGVHTLSPILIKDRESARSLVHDNCDYPTTLAAVINHDIQKMTDRVGSVSVINQTGLKVRKRSVAGRTVLAQKGTFWLDGDPRDLAHVLDWGIGKSTALGFGLVVAEGNPSAEMVA